MQKLLAGQDVVLSEEQLDRIDAVVAPGASVGAVHQLPTPAILDSALRRRSHSKPRTSGSYQMLKQLRERLEAERAAGDGE
jgi:hypothetical protein